MNRSDRFFAKVQPDGNGCLVWQGELTDDGYGIFLGRPAHRWLLERVYGRNADLVADHLCRNRACVRPSHLEFVTIAENIRRGVAAERARARNAARTHCHRGHSILGENLYLYQRSDGVLCRMCKRCMEENHLNPERKVYAAAYQRIVRANRKLLLGDPKIAVLHGVRGPRVFVCVSTGDDLASLDRDRQRAVESYKASRVELPEAMRAP